MTQTIIVFAHLRWNFAYQRPQHLLTRLARQRRVIYFEEPLADSATPELFLQCTSPEANVLVCTPHTPSKQPGYHEEQIPYLTILLKRLLATEQVEDYIVWFYTPLALPLAKILTPRASVYDCMDELSGFPKAPRQLAQRESALLKTADIVFTAGPSLHQAKKDLHPDTHCFPSSVDADHFGKAIGDGNEPVGQGGLAQTSWDDTAREMEEHLTRIIAEKASPSSARMRVARSVTALSAPADGRLPHIVVGAGPTGLSAAYHLGDNVLLLEQHATTGGWCRSIVDKGFTFDYAGHIMFSNEPYVQQMYEQLLGDNVHWQEREAWIFSKETYTRYPFHGALYGLPPEVIKECLVGALESRFGSIHQGGGQVNAATGSDHQLLPLLPRREEPRNFEEFTHQVWGTGIARHFAMPYNRKFWGVPLKELETSWLGRVPLPDLEEMIDGALHPVPKPIGPNARFGYPLRGGFQALMDGFLPHLAGKVRHNAQVVGVSPNHRTVTIADGTSFRYQTLTSTMPLPELVRMIGKEAPAEVRRAAEDLHHLSIRNVNIGVDRPNITEKHWILVPEDPVFHRLFVQGNASPHCNPPGCFSLTCEISYSDLKPLPYEGEALIERCIADCVRIGVLRPDDRIVTANELDMPYAYVIYDHNRAQNVATIRNWLEKWGIFPAGRYGEWQYYNSDQALLAGRDVAEKVRQHAEQQPPKGRREPRQANLSTRLRLN